MNSKHKPVSQFLVPVKRLLAFGIDWLAIAAYMLLLLVAASSFSGGNLQLALPYDAFGQQLLGFVYLTLPVVVYFAVCEFVFGKTIGKRVMGLQVVGVKNVRFTMWRSFVRTAAKFLPWELAHFCVHQFIAANTAGREPDSYVVVALVGVYALVGLYLFTMIFSKSHRTPYDHLAGSRVDLS